MRICAVRRKECFSPNSIENDAAILDEVTAILRSIGHEVTVIGEDSDVLLHYNSPSDKKSLFDAWLSMGRMLSTLSVLKSEQQCGSLVINSGFGVENCRRDVLRHLMRDAGIPMPDDVGDNGYWVKRADMAAQSHEDVVFAHNKEQADEVIARFTARGIHEVVVQAHVTGDVVKFYGVQGTGFFRIFYPGDDEMTKFGDEFINGRPHHYAFDPACLQRHAEQLSCLAEVKVYGGDCVVSKSGDYRIIDFNDWPSFSRCRHDAAVAIASLLIPYSS